MVHYSGVAIIDLKQVNISFQKLIPEKSGKVTCLTIQKAPTRKSFKGDHWILPELKQLVTQTNHKKICQFAQNSFHLALIHAYR